MYTDVENDQMKIANQIILKFESLLKEIIFKRTLILFHQRVVIHYQISQPMHAR